MQFSTLIGTVAIVAGLASAAPATEQSAVKGRRWQECYDVGTECTNILGGIGGCTCNVEYLHTGFNCVCI
ncbi:hypothetical protein CORC01_07663 [Colletotrichum orchidophilum]|uniref:EGF-like domain-containing protein n=1 Tax=Colletotrichum orchidophilum TaxID=1209926 RepID=A0A1G4B6P0_9PEZI|nr:uncharacterized protein CORC01_07663 [Colletotrichum orchidophilum]OHE97054.1 hypothetical protein CORC01_07663 [Colletotrichum orchidophilum]